MKHVIIDTDAGVDDALAIIFALRSPELRVEAITTVAGNVEVKKCTRNCLLILELLSPRYIPIVAQGAERPVRRKLVTAPEVHGEDGLGNVTPTYPPPRMKPTKENASEVILELLKKFQGKLTIITLGPLTNLAHVLQQEANALRQAKEIIAMGGAFRVPGNTGPVAEFNMFVDPDAARMVLDAKLPLTLIPLDVTEQVVLERRQTLAFQQKRHSKIGDFIAKFTRLYMEYHRRTEGFHGGYLHDPLTVAVAIKQGLARYRNLHVEIECDSELTRGMTVAEMRPGRESRKANVRVAIGVQRYRFLQMFESRVWS